MKKILELVNGLAVFENKPDAVIIKEQDYIDNFEQGVFDSLVVEHEKDGVVGMAIFFLVWSTWKGRMLWLEDLYIQESHRRQGLGKKLIEAVFEKGKELKCFLVKWEVLDWNTPAVTFYEKLGATIEKNWWDCKKFLQNFEDKQTKQ